MELMGAAGSTRHFLQIPPAPDALDRICQGAFLSRSDRGALEIALVVDPSVILALDSACLDRLERRYLRCYARPSVYGFLRTITKAVNEDDKIQTRTALKAGTVFPGAPVLALAIGDPRRPFAEASARQALVNMALLAEALGLGTCFADEAGALLDRDRQARRVLCLHSPNKVIGILCLGHPGDVLPPDEGPRLTVRRIGTSPKAAAPHQFTIRRTS
ncbi:MAG TPA: nitroreductase family protein [Acidobacteriota bacterium]|nr:nitroreductase family protein [Acidobacteriota bacterium]